MGGLLGATRDTIVSVGLRARSRKVPSPRLHRTAQVFTGITRDGITLQANRARKIQFAELPEQRRLVKGALVKRLNKLLPVFTADVRPANTDARR